jgi:tRNA U34 2-thiouridine synthase MnmA/TrmU
MFWIVENKMEHRGHGIALFSGGLDSALAILLILQQNIKVTALTFLTHFGCDITDKSSCSHDPFSAAEKFGFDVKMLHLGEKFIEIVKNPPHGYGKNMNPCIDCRILMLREAKEFMEMVGADFVFTGEVLGQRPMSQHLVQLNLITRESGLGRKLVRPLSGRLLPPTIPESAGLLERDKLENISGRGRKRQMELADKFGLEDYPNPAAGCLLTDVGYSRRLKDLLEHRSNIDFNDLNLLKIGRHFRIDEKTKVIVGRNQEENRKIEQYRRNGVYLFEAQGVGSPLTILDGNVTEEKIKLAAAITARYCDGKHLSEVRVVYSKGGESQSLVVAPGQDETLDKIRI